MVRKPTNYSPERSTLENLNNDNKYSDTGESEFSRDSTIPFDEDEVLSERHYNLGHFENNGKRYIRMRELETEPSYLPNHRGRGPKGYRRTDQMIKEDVIEALYRSTEVDASDIEVFVETGIVTLKGSVKTQEQISLADSTIENLAGVDNVFNEIRVSSQDSNNVSLGKFGLINNITGMN